jgi:hypothetical protein
LNVNGKVVMGELRLGAAQTGFAQRVLGIDVTYFARGALDFHMTIVDIPQMPGTGWNSQPRSAITALFS